MPVYTVVFKLLRSPGGRRLVLRVLKNKRLRSLVYGRMKRVLKSKRVRGFTYELAKRRIIGRR